jgi:DNA-directed RNA polymerase subunit H (RpoH/RPB5)
MKIFSFLTQKMSFSRNVQLFIEIINMMGIQGYDILPFEYLIKIQMDNEYYLERGEQDKVIQINEQELLKKISKYRRENFGVPDELFSGGRMSFSMIFDHCENGMTTLVCIANEIDELTSKNETTDMFIKLKYITEFKTNKRSSDPNNVDNKVSGIFVLSKGVSSFSKTFLDDQNSSKIIYEDDILHRCYDHCMQSFVTAYNSDEKNRILGEVGLTSSNAPSTSISNDVFCKINNIKAGSLLKITRDQISPEETTKSVFLRVVKE